MDSEGGVLGPHCGLWVVVVGTQHVFIMLVYHSRPLTAVDGGGCSTFLHCSFPSMMWLPTGMGGVTWRVLAANCQWAVDSGGAVLVGWVVIDAVGLLTSLVGSFIALGLSSAVFVGAGHRVPVVTLVMCGCCL